MKSIKYIGCIAVILFAFLICTEKGFAEEVQQDQKMMKIYVTADYPDHIQIHSTFKSHVLSTEAFLENHKDLTLVKQTKDAIYVRKIVKTHSPLYAVLSIMGVDGNAPLKVEKASFNPMERIQPFIQFESDAFKA